MKVNKKVACILAVLMLFAVKSAYAQFGDFGVFGKNKPVWEEHKKNFYQSEHFDVWHSLDLQNANQKIFFEDTLYMLEGAYSGLSVVFEHNVKERVPIIIMNFSEFENNNIVAEFLPEGVGAFVESERGRMVLRSDFSPPLNRAIATHELAHIFQFSVLQRGLLSRVANFTALPQGFIEGGAEFLAGRFSPHTRDDIRRINQRTDAGNPELFLPTWERFMADQADPYGQWFMVFEFLESSYGAGVKFQVQGLKEKGKSLGEQIEILTGGKVKNPDKYGKEFDRIHRDFWADKYVEQMRKDQRPYAVTASFEGQNITPREIPFGILSFDLSGAGSEVAALSFQKNGISLMKFPIAREEKDKTGAIVNLTPDFPPKDFEYVVSQRGNTWPFNGSDVAWSPTERKIAFFAKSGRDHELFLADADNPDNFIKIKIPYDQAFSPAFSPDGGKIYFSASKNVQRDIYEFDLATLGFKNLTNDSNFDTAPAVSPDGKTLAFVALDGDYQKLFLFDLRTSEKKQLTFNRHNDDSPVFWSERTILYVSDERNGSWNICTIDIETNEVRQWTEFFGGAFVPKPIPNSHEEIAFIEFWQYDQFRGQIFKNLELYRARLVNPLLTYEMENKRESMIYSFWYQNALLSKLDENQVRNPLFPPPKWALVGRSATVGLASYWGAFGYGEFKVSDILENHIYQGGFAFSGSNLRLLDFAYVNREKRLNWGYGAYNHKMPISYLHFDFLKGYPEQPVLGLTLGEEFGGSIFAERPFSKFSRIEFGVNISKRSYKVFIDDFLLENYSWIFSDADLQFIDFFKKSNFTSVSFKTSYVRDTVLYSYAAAGPIHGNAFRTGVEVSHKYVSAMFDYRRYKRLSNSSLMAFRAAGGASSRPTGEFALMGGDSTLRAYPYGYLAGNQMLYGSAEIRFPFVTVLFPGGFGIPSRGFLFSDYGFARFSNQNFPTQKGASLGAGLQFMGFNFVVAYRKLEGFKEKVRDTYVSRGWNF